MTSLEDSVRLLMIAQSSLVANIIKVIALHYVLYHDIRITPRDSMPANDRLILRAQIDTKVFQCLHRAEKLVYQALHRLIFLSAERLTRDAILPVCLTMVWTLSAGRFNPLLLLLLYSPILQSTCSLSKTP